MGFATEGGLVHVVDRKSIPSTAIDEDLDDEASDTWSYTQVDEESLQRQDEVQRLAKMQAQSVSFFKMAMQALEDEAAAEGQARRRETQERAQAQAYMRRGGDHEAMFQKSFSVSDVMFGRRARNTRFHTRCKELKVMYDNHMQKVTDDLAQQERRAAERMREMQQRQREKSFAEALKRAEQQKASKELRRERERVYENFYAKQVLAAAMGTEADRLRPQSQSATRPMSMSGTSSPKRRASLGSTQRPSSQASTQHYAEGSKERPHSPESSQRPESPDEGTQRPSSQGSTQRPDSPGSTHRPESRGSHRPVSRGSMWRPDSRGSFTSAHNMEAIISKEAIYADMKKSRAHYNSELKKMAVTLQQNEKRTEAYWRKLLGPDWRKMKNDRLDDGDAEQAVGHSSDHEFEAGRRASVLSGISRRSTMTMPRRRRASPAIPFDLGDPSPGGMSRSFSSASSLLESTWELRNSRSEQVREQIQAQKEDRWAKIEESIGKSKLRRSTSATALQESTTARLQEWAAKSKTCKERKAAQEVKSDQSLGLKDRTFSERWEQAQHRLDEVRADKLAAENRRQEALNTKTKALQQMHMEKVMAKIEQKAGAANDIIEQRLQDYSQRASGDHSEKAKHISKQKSVEEEQFRKKARGESERKDARAAQLAERKKRGPLENMRTKRNPKRGGALMIDPLSPESASSLSVPESPQHLSNIELALSLGPSHAPPEQPILGRTLSIETDLATESAGPTPLASRTSAKRTPAVTPMAPKLTMSPVSPTGADILRCDGFKDPPVPGSDSEPGCDSGDEQGYLEDLERCSVQWLQDMRRKSALV